MRKIIVSEFLSLDGVMEAPEKWVFPYQSQEVAQAIEAQAYDTEALLLGRNTYEIFAAFWPNYQGKQDARIADRMNNQPKYVVSTTLEQTSWDNSTLIRSNVLEEVRQLKQVPGGDIGLVGSATLVQSLIQADLIDEFRLMVHPVALGSGKRLINDSSQAAQFKLVDCHAFGSGVVLLTYAVEHRPQPVQL